MEKTMETGEVEMSLMAPGSKQAPVEAALNRFEKIYQPCLAELVGTTFFVFIGCVSVIENEGSTGRLQPALVHGLAIAVIVACLAKIR